MTLIDIAPHPLLPFGAQLGERWGQMHRDRGVDVRLGVGISALRGRGAVEHGRAERRTTVEVDTVSAGARLRAEHRVARRLGLELNPAVVCDATLNDQGP